MDWRLPGDKVTMMLLRAEIGAFDTGDGAVASFPWAQ